MRTVSRWAADAEDPGLLILSPTTEPVGTWPWPLPRVGIHVALPRDVDTGEWFGLGPGEAYSGTTAAVRVGRFTACVDDLKTPYVLPQENGNRRQVRYARLSSAHRSGLVIIASPHLDLTVRPWTSEDLAAAQHTTDLRPCDQVYVNLDAAQQGILAAAVVAVLGNAVVAVLAHAAGASEDFDPLHLSVYAPLTVFGVVLGAIGWAVVRRAAKNPAGLLRWLVSVLVVVSFAPDLSLLGGGTPGSGSLAVAALMAMHVVVAAVVVAAYRRVLPLPVH
ncbi:hypothetical protein JHN63_12555 [Streptomyces sp. MBT65]|nr:hypothetical protein [Streptomyces sp. MBT65]